MSMTSQFSLYKPHFPTSTDGTVVPIRLEVEGSWAHQHSAQIPSLPHTSARVLLVFKNMIQMTSPCVSSRSTWWLTASNQLYRTSPSRQRLSVHQDNHCGALVSPRGCPSLLTFPPLLFGSTPSFHFTTDLRMIWPQGISRVTNSNSVSMLILAAWLLFQMTTIQETSI